MKKKKVLITAGMSGDAILIITNAPQNVIEEWCKNYNQEQENGENTYFDRLKKNYYVNVIFDSENGFSNDDIDIIGYDEIYDLFHIS